MLFLGARLVLFLGARLVLFLGAKFVALILEAEVGSPFENSNDF